MPDQVAITLNVSNANTAGYTPTVAANGSTYYYQYTGGSLGSGNTQVHQGHPATITVTLSAASNYSISVPVGVVVTNDTMEDITTSNTTTTATITDSATDLESNMYYKVNVTDSTGSTSFDCDPRIDNVGN